VKYLLNLAYLALLAVAWPWLLYKTLRTGKYRQGLPAKFLGHVPVRTGNRFCVWLHAVSVGEVNLLAPLLREIAGAHPDWECVISTTTHTGYALAQKNHPALSVFYCPLDFSWAVWRAMRRIRPNLLVLTELELWPNLVAAAKERGAKVAVVNGRLSERSFRGYGRIGWLARRVLRQIDVVAAQNEEYADRFRRLGAQNVVVTGSIKFDGAQSDRRNARTEELRRLASISVSDRVFLAGSTQEPEEHLALETYQELSSRHPELRLILVPRHPERFDAVARLLDASGLRWVRRSELFDHSSDRTPARGGEGERGRGGERIPAVRGARILLVDTIGELGAWWGMADIAYVGGSMGTRGGQNMIEPAAYGAAVSFGPDTRNFRDIAAALLRAEAAVVVRDGRELSAFVARCLDEPSYAASLGRRAQSLVLFQQGAARRTLEILPSVTGASTTSHARSAA
jgi:3-deoxy-D-manno-octulosonic-acid transferase